MDKIFTEFSRERHTIPWHIKLLLLFQKKQYLRLDTAKFNKSTAAFKTLFGVIYVMDEVEHV